MAKPLTYRVDRRQFMRLSGLATGGLFVAACAVPTTGTELGAVAEMAEDYMDVYVWPSISLVRPEGSDVSKYEEAQSYIAQETGIRPNGFVPPPGAAGRERLNLLLSSRSERLDLFSSNWT